MEDAINTLIKLRHIFRDIFDDEALDISENTAKSDIEDWDSIAHVKIILAIEEEFNIRFTTEEVASIKTIGEFMKAIHQHTGKPL